MDRISDSGSDGCGSIPHGDTKKAANRSLFCIPMRNAAYRAGLPACGCPLLLGLCPKPRGLRPSARRRCCFLRKCFYTLVISIPTTRKMLRISVRGRSKFGKSS